MRNRTVRNTHRVDEESKKEMGVLCKLGMTSQRMLSDLD